MEKPVIFAELVCNNMVNVNQYTNAPTDPESKK
jgi:hypothetical protein